MLPEFLVPETTIREAGAGPEISLGDQRGGTLLLTLGITRTLEHEGLDISIWGSADGVNWGTKPVISFPRKFYCGTYQVILDLSNRPDIQYLRAKWQVTRWGRGDRRPLFTVYLFIKEFQQEMVAAGAA